MPNVEDKDIEKQLPVVGNKKDISSLKMPPSSIRAKKSKTCFISLDHM
jgi:hypothetical protein